ncbi:hypothetical protein W02_20490 [Nitrospira sp. KM1]|nr:hypothetical protein W02_20490 [Nitrospira sp. KM1]
MRVHRDTREDSVSYKHSMDDRIVRECLRSIEMELSDGIGSGLSCAENPQAMNEYSLK